jgi:predicted Zn-dependent protease
LLGRWLWLGQERLNALQQAREGEFQAAAPTLHRILRRSPDDLEVLQTLVRGYLKGNNDVAARPLLDRWCQLRPNEPKPFLERISLLRNKDPAAALKDGLHLLRLAPSDPYGQLLVAGLYFDAGRFPEAEKACRAFLAEEPKQTEAIQLLARILQAQGQTEQAAALLDDLLQKDPGNTATLMTRGRLYLDLGQANQAIPLLEQVVNLDPGRQRTGRYLLARAYEQANRHEDAQRVLAELRLLQEAEVLDGVLSSQPDNPDVQLRAARAFLAAGKRSAALDLIGKVLQRRADDREAHQLLATYYEQIGQPGRAAEHRSKARALD